MFGPKTPDSHHDKHKAKVDVTKGSTHSRLYFGLCDIWGGFRVRGWQDEQNNRAVMDAGTGDGAMRTRRVQYTEAQILPKSRPYAVTVDIIQVCVDYIADSEDQIW